MYPIRKVSELSGVSVRTLHHYDEIGLLSPKKDENGYRQYSDEDMSRLQTILFYKYLGFSLKHIKGLLTEKEGDLLVHLRNQLNLLQEEQKRLITLVDTLQKTIASQERKTTMSTPDKFKGFVYHDNQKYTQAAMDAYGKDVVEKAIAKQKGKEQELTDGFNTLFFAFSDNREKGLPAVAQENVALSKKLHEHLCTYAFDCSHEVFSSIGYGYVQNEDFKRNIDQFGEGTAQYVCDAIQRYVSEASAS